MLSRELKVIIIFIILDIVIWMSLKYQFTVLLYCTRTNENKNYMI